MLLRHSSIVIYVTAFILIIVFQAYNWYLLSLQSFNIYTDQVLIIYLHTHVPLDTVPLANPLLLLTIGAKKIDAKTKKLPILKKL
jgi:hypothetical protein